MSLKIQLAVFIAGLIFVDMKIHTTMHQKKGKREKEHGEREKGRQGERERENFYQLFFIFYLNYSLRFHLYFSWKR